MLKRNSLLLATLFLLSLLPVSASAGTAVTAAYTGTYDGGKCGLTVSAGDTPLAGSVYLAGYDNENRLKSISIAPLSAAAGEELTVKFDYPEKAGNYSFFVWDADLKPLTEPVEVPFALHNVAEGARASVTQPSSMVGDIPAIVDGNEETGWTAGPGYMSKAKVDLGKEYPISEIRIKSAADADPSARYYLQLFDERFDETEGSTSFKGYVTGLNDSGWITYTLPEDAGNTENWGWARYISILSEAAGNISINEIQIMSTLPRPTSNKVSPVDFRMNSVATTGKPSNLFDGNENTSWITASGQYTQLRVDLGAEYNLEKIRVKLPDNANSANAYNIYVVADMAVSDSVLHDHSTPATPGWSDQILSYTKPVRYLWITSVPQLEIQEVEFWTYDSVAETPGETLYNVAQKPVTSYVTGSAGAGTPDAMFDGDESTSWQSLAGTTTELLIDLEEQYTVKEVRIKSAAGADTSKSYSIQLFDDDQYRDANGYYGRLNGFNNEEWVTFQLPGDVQTYDTLQPPPTMGKLRCLLIQSSDAISIAEIQVLATEPKAEQTLYNVAQGAAADVYVPASMAGSIANSIFDGDDTTGWNATGGTENKVKIDLGGLYPVKEVRIKSLAGSDPNATYYIQFFDGDFPNTPGYLGYVRGGNDSDWITFRIPGDLDQNGAHTNDKLQYLNIVSENGSVISIAEIEILSTEPRAE